MPAAARTSTARSTAALSQLHDSSRPTFVIFLTDGLPTIGETNEAKIVANARSNNKVHARIFDFGVGYDVNSRLLDKLARENFGLSEYVRPNENIERSVAALYGRIGSPVMTDVKLTIDIEGLKPEDGGAVNRMYPKEVVDLFAGEQLVIVGRYKKPGDAKVTITGKVGDSETATDQKFDFPVKFVEHSDDSSQAFVEKLWAVRRVGEIIDEIDLNGKNDELVQELVSLAMKHGILTPYTSFLADENAPRQTMAESSAKVGQRLDSLHWYADGREGVEQRGLKEMFRSSSVPAAAPIRRWFHRSKRRRRAANRSGLRRRQSRQEGSRSGRAECASDRRQNVLPPSRSLGRLRRDGRSRETGDQTWRASRRSSSN